MIKNIVDIDKRLAIENRFLLKSIKEFPSAVPVYKLLSDYLDIYCKHHQLSAEDVVESYNRFSERYVADIQTFLKTGAYPVTTGSSDITIQRLDYDIFLIASCLLTKHRFQVMYHLEQQVAKDNSSLIIGVGSGLELLFINESVDAYDLTISDFIQSHFSNCNFHKTLFKGTGTYSRAYAIELLEHLEDPYKLIKDVYNSLENDGYFICTTAENIPQFDHLYNFTNPLLFKKQVNSIGFSIEKRVIIPHNYHFYNINANNTFYVLRK